jgi:predicted Zn-dependent peptidase
MSASLESVLIHDLSVPYILEKNHQIPIVSISMIFQGAGILSKNNYVPGLANFAKEILNEGTEKLNSEEFAKFLDDNAISISSKLTKTFISISIFFLKEKINEATQILQDLLLQPNLSIDSINRVRKIIKSDILTNNLELDYITNLNLKKLVFKNTPLEFPATGTLDSIEKINAENLRFFISNAFVIKKAIGLIGGDISKKESELFLKNVLEKLPVGEPEEPHLILLPERPLEKIEYKKTKQAYIYFLSPLNMSFNDPEYYKMRLAIFILGSSGFGSRLMEKIRVESGLAYSVYAYTSISKCCSMIKGYLQTNIQNMHKAKALIYETIYDFLENGVTLQEFEDAKNYILGSEPLRHETVESRLMIAFDQYCKGNDINFYKEELNLIKNLKIESLNRFISNHKELLKLSFSILTAKES